MPGSGSSMTLLFTNLTPSSRVRWECMQQCRIHAQAPLLFFFWFESSEGSCSSRGSDSLFTRDLAIPFSLSYCWISTVFGVHPYPFNYPTRRLTVEEILAKFIDEGKREHEEMEIFIKEFRTTNELLLKKRSNLLSELEIEVNELSKVMGNVLIPKNEVKGVTTRGGKMNTSKEIKETGINKNEPPRFEQDVHEKLHDDGVENKSLNFQDNPDDEEDTRSSQEYMNDLELECHERALLAKSKRFFKKGTQRLSDEEEVLSDANDMVEVKVLMALADDESDLVGKESARNGEWVKISMRKSHDYYSAKESTSVCSTSLNPMEKLSGAEPQTESQPGPKTIKSILKSCSTRKAKTSKDAVKNEINNFSTLAKGNKNVSASKRNLAPTCKLKIIKTKDDIPMSVNTILVNFNMKDKTLKCLLSLQTPKHNDVLKEENKPSKKLQEQCFQDLLFKAIMDYKLNHWHVTAQNRTKLCPVYIHNHKDHVRKFDKKANDCYFLGYSLISKVFKVFNTRRQQIEETFHITFDESTKAIKFSKPSVNNITIAESESYPPDEYLHHFEPSNDIQVERMLFRL
ncbi:hypothetical protein Tco_1503919 [Tanacetum coccineum]